MKLLICGDSFASDWSIEYPNSHGWPTLLRNHHDVTNLAQAGCSEYKIWLQLKSVDLYKYDKILISHTSPYRVYVKQHPVHKIGLHQYSDLIYTDIKSHSASDKTLLPLVDYFENYCDLEYMEFVHNLICKEIDLLTKKLPVIHCTHFLWDDLYQFDSMINFYKTYKTHPGLINHYSDQGNQIVYKKILEIL